MTLQELKGDIRIRFGTKIAEFICDTTDGFTRPFSAANDLGGIDQLLENNGVMRSGRIDWLRAVHPSLNGSTPLQCIRDGKRPDNVAEVQKAFEADVAEILSAINSPDITANT